MHSSATGLSVFPQYSIKAPPDDDISDDYRPQSPDERPHSSDPYSNPPSLYSRPESIYGLPKSHYSARPQSPIRPDHMYPNLKVHQLSRARSCSSASHEELSRETSTQDLAEFLRTSSPKDFQKFLSKSSEEQLFSFGSTYLKTLKFLRPMTSKAKLRAMNALPNTVVAKRTANGKPYLQIHVDYDEAYYHDHIQSPDMDPRFASEYGNPEFGSDFVFRESMLPPSTLASPPPSETERPNLSPAPWVPSIDVDADTLQTYKNYINALNPHPETHNDKPEGNPVSLSLGAVGGEGRGKPTPFTEKRRSDPSTYFPYPDGNTPVIRRSTSLSHMSRRSDSSRSSAYDTGDDGESSRKHTHRGAPRPGPPPIRSLPALPESRGPAYPEREASPKSQESIHSFQESESPRAPQASPIESHRSTLASFGSSTSGSTSSTLHHTRTLSREQKVKSRKSRDMAQARLRRQAATQQETLNALTANSSKVGLLVTREQSMPVLPYSQDDMGPFPMSGSQKLSRQIRNNTPTGAPTPPISPDPSTMRSPRPPPLQYSRPLVRVLPSPTIRSSMSCYSQSSNGDDMESRIQAVERKNRMLEKALIAVIRGAVGNDERQAELQRANCLEDLLRRLQMLDTGLYVPDEGAERI